MEIYIEDGHYKGPVPERKKKHEEGTSELIACMAYQQPAVHMVKGF